MTFPPNKFVTTPRVFFSFSVTQLVMSFVFDLPLLNLSCSQSTVLQERLTKYMYHSSYLSGAKEEILANLANFAYDPINYDHFRKLNVVDLFMGKREMQVEFCFSQLRLVLTSHSFSDTLTSTQLQVQTNLDVWMLNGNHCIIYLLGSFSIDGGNGSENQSFFKLCCVYSSSLKMSNVSKFPWS